MDYKIPNRRSRYWSPWPKELRDKWTSRDVFSGLVLVGLIVIMYTVIYVMGG